MGVSVCLPVSSPRVVLSCLAPNPQPPTHPPPAVVAEYAWERAYERTWEAVQEDESGRIRAGDTSELKAKRQRLAEIVPRVRRGMIRYLFLVLDLSRSTRQTDFTPTRRRAMLLRAQEFVKRYFDQNPLSQLGVIVTRNQTAEKLTDLTANPTRHLEVGGWVCVGAGVRACVRGMFALCVVFLAMDARLKACVLCRCWKGTR